MRHMIIALLSCLVLIPTAAQDKKGNAKPKNGIVWAKTWEAALEEAKIRNAPIHVAIHQDG